MFLLRKHRLSGHFDPKPENETKGKLMVLAVVWFSDDRGRRTDATERAQRREDRYALRQVEAGKRMSDVCREMGVSLQAFYSWKRRYTGLGLKELRERRQLREENRKLKTMVADLSFDKHILQGVLSKKA
jgi:putative transposase